MNIATLNMNGFTSTTDHMSGMEKWGAINHTLNKHKIAISALQETHLDREHVQRILSCFGKKMDVLKSEHEPNPHWFAGVAFIINKMLISQETYEATMPIQGRAIALKVKWHEVEETTIINVYAPNNRANHPDF